MNKNIKQLIENFVDKQKKTKKWQKVLTILSCFVVVFTIYQLIIPARANNTEQIYKLILEDQIEKTWKTENKLVTRYELELQFVGMDKQPLSPDNNVIGNKTFTLNGSTNWPDVVYGFNHIPYRAQFPNVDKDVVDNNHFNIKEISYTNTSEKYQFHHAEVDVNGDGNWKSFEVTLTTEELQDSTPDEEQLEKKLKGLYDIYCQDASQETYRGDYGWRGNYWENNKAVSYKINANTKFRFVYTLTRQGQRLNDPQSLNSSYGIKFGLFNYTDHTTNNEGVGINNNGVYKFFNFRNSKSSDGTETKINTDVDQDGYMDVVNGTVQKLNHATVKRKLEGGYPVFDCRGYCTGTQFENKDGFSLGYLFGSKTNPLGTQTQGVTAYSPQNTLLQKDSNDNYYYLSENTAVDYDTDNNIFLLRDYIEQNEIMSSFTGTENQGEFLPFNYNTEDTDKKIYLDKDVDHWYGMTMEFNFSMPKNGSVKGAPMKFKFTGDDDVWVFIDDVLVLDLGGTHGVVEGSIDFSTGNVIGYKKWSGVDYSNLPIANQLNIKEAFRKALTEEEFNEYEWNGNTFKDYTTHKLTFFYLERGAAVANCGIEFNMPVLPSGSLSVEKEFQGTATQTEKYKNETYEFTIYDKTTGEAQPLNKAEYKINGISYNTDEFGKFRLKDGEKATFTLVNNNKYEIIETNPGKHAISHSCIIGGVNCAEINRTGDLTINPESAYLAVFTNKIKLLDLQIKKMVHYVIDNTEFEFKLTLKDQNGSPVIIPSDNNLKYKVVENNVTFNLSHDEIITIKDIPYDTVVTLQETFHDGYTTIIKKGEQTLANGDIYEFTLDENSSAGIITVNNMPGVTLPETGGNGIFKYLIIGFSLILCSLIYGYRYIFKLKEGDE